MSGLHSPSLSPKAQRVFEMARDQMRPIAIAAALNLPATAVHEHLRRLREQGLLPRGKKSLLHEASPREQKILALAKQGLPPREIHPRVGGTKRSVISCLSKLKRRRLLSAEREKPRLIVLSEDAAKLIDAEAARRGQTAQQLAEAILKTVAFEELFTAVLD